MYSFFHFDRFVWAFTLSFNFSLGQIFTMDSRFIAIRLAKVGTMRKLFLSRLMHGARLKWTESRLLGLVQRLGERGNWRQAMQVVHWVHCREHYSHCHSRCGFSIHHYLMELKKLACSRLHVPPTLRGRFI